MTSSMPSVLSSGAAAAPGAMANNCDHEKIHDHLTLNANRLSKWADLKKEIREFTMAGKRWGQDDAMDVDALRGMDRKKGYTPLWRALDDFP